MQIFILKLCLSDWAKFSIIFVMRKAFGIFIIINTLCIGAYAAATRDAELTNTTGYNYNYMYPYLNNQMRINLNPGVTTSQSSNPINTIARTTRLAPVRNVVPRPTARAATSAPTTRTSVSTASQNRNVQTRTATPSSTNTRRVVSRPGISNARSGIITNARATTRNDQTNGYQSTSSGPAMSTLGTQRTSSTRCLADYSECMDNYCVRENTKYNRCYCSAKLSQIDSRYQNAIDSLINQILKIQGGNDISDSDINEYWMSVFGEYTDTNSWENIDSALNIDWASMDSRVRGQNAFATGHEYCSQYLRGCEYMASNLRDAYRSEINRDCATYEQYLENIQNAAESIIKANK